MMLTGMKVEKIVEIFFAQIPVQKSLPITLCFFTRGTTLQF